MIKRGELGVDGMTCAACSTAVERAVKKLDGVTEASVNLATNRAAFSYDPAKVKLAQIREAVTKAGLHAAGNSPVRTRATQSRRSEKKRCAPCAGVLSRRSCLPRRFCISQWRICSPGLKVPLPAFLSPHMHPLTFALVQLLLTVPVLIAGGRFFRVGMRTLFKGAPNMDTLVAIGTGSAFLYGVYATVLIYLGNVDFAQHLYFESAAVVITLVMVGKYLEAVSKSKTSEAIKKLMNLRPKTAVIIKDGVELEVAL